MHTIFVVHGMGSYDAGWQAEVEKLIKDGYKSFGPPIDFDTIYKVVPLTYDNVFRDYLDQLNNENDRFDLIKNIATSTPNKLAKAVLRAAKKDPNDEFLYTHVADLLFYTVTEKQGQVVSQVQADLAENLQSGQTWSVIAHSLGTRVIHDVLQSSYSAGTGFRQAFGKPLCVLMLANVSRLIQELAGGDVYKTELFPSAKVDTGGCYFYANVRHELDPIAMPKPFRPPLGWQTGRDDGPNMYVDVKVPAEDTTQPNVHAMTHYLSNPLALRPFFNKTYTGPRLRDPLIDDTIFGTVYQEYKQSTAKAKIVAHVDKLEGLSSDPFGNWDQIVKLWSKFHKLVADF